MPSHPPIRIVSLQPSATAILEAIGRLDSVVACTKYCVEICPEAARDRVIVADSWSANSTQILAVKPDLVIAAVPYQEEAVSEILKSGIRFLGLAPHTLSDIYMDIASIAGITGAAEAGEELIAQMQAEIENVHEATRHLELRSVFCEEWGNPVIASQPWVAELVEAAGGIFVGNPGRKTTAELVATADPDVLVTAWCGAGDRVPLEKIVRTRGWSELKAVRNGRVYCIPDEWLNTPAPTLLHGLRALVAAIHPERFPAPERLRRIANASAAMPNQPSAL